MVVLLVDESASRPETLTRRRFSTFPRLLPGPLDGARASPRRKAARRMVM